VDFNNASKGGGGSSANEGTASWYTPKSYPELSIASLYLANPNFIAQHALLSTIVTDPGFRAFALERLNASHYREKNLRVEMTGQIYIGSDGSIIYKTLPRDPEATANSTNISGFYPPTGMQAVEFHTHPDRATAPSDADKANPRSNNLLAQGLTNLGFVATARGAIYGYERR
jgi:hypothetical protein